MQYMRRVLVACLLIGLCAELTAASEVAALVDGPVQVDEAFRDAFQRVERNAEHHYTKTLLRHTYDKLNRENTDQIRRTLSKQVAHPLANETPEDTKRRMGLKRQLVSTKAAISEMSRRAHELHRGAKELLRQSKYDIEEASAAAVIRHERAMLAKRNEEATLAQTLKWSPTQRLGKQLEHEAQHQEVLSDDVEVLKASMLLKCKHLRETNTRRAGHIKAQLNTAKLEQQAAEKSFQTSSKHVDQVIKAFAVKRKQAREAGYALSKAKSEAKKSKNPKVTSEAKKLLKVAQDKQKPAPKAQEEAPAKKPVPQEKAAGAAGPAGEGKLAQLIAKDDVAAAQERADKMSLLLGQGQGRVDHALKVMAAAKGKVTTASAELRHHMDLEKTVIEHVNQVTSMCKPAAPAGAPQKTAVAVNATSAGNQTVGGPTVTVSQLLNETIGFARKARATASKMKDQAAMEMVSTQTSPPVVVPVPTAEEPSTGDGWTMKAEDKMKDQIDDEQKKAKRMHKHADSETIKIAHLTNEVKARDAPAQKLGEAVKVVTLKQCKVAKIGLNLLCKNRLKSPECADAKDLYSRHC